MGYKGFYMGALITAQSYATIRSDSHAIPKSTTSMTVEGMSHAEHTVDSFGIFMHPFKYVENKVQ